MTQVSCNKSSQGRICLDLLPYCVMFAVFRVHTCMSYSLSWFTRAMLQEDITMPTSSEFIPFVYFKFKATLLSLFFSNTMSLFLQDTKKSKQKTKLKFRENVECPSNFSREKHTYISTSSRIFLSCTFNFQSILIFLRFGVHYTLNNICVAKRLKIPTAHAGVLRQKLWNWDILIYNWLYM